MAFYQTLARVTNDTSPGAYTQTFTRLAQAYLLGHLRPSATARPPCVIRASKRQVGPAVVFRSISRKATPFSRLRQTIQLLRLRLVRLVPAWLVGGPIP